MKKKLLLADDSVTIQKVVQITFSHDDYDLTVVDNGDIAYEKARSQRPDLILADVFMPGKNGYELCAAVKNDPTLTTVPVLLLTGTFEPFDEAKARSVGADRWIAKPFESQALIASVEELLTQAAQAPVSAPPVLVTPVAAAPVEAAIFSPPELSSNLPDDIWGSEFEAPGVVGSDDFPAVLTSQDDLWDVSGFETETPVPVEADDDDLWGNFDSTPAVEFSSAPTVSPAVDDSWETEDFSAAFSDNVPGAADAFGGGVVGVPLADEVEVLEEVDLFEAITAASPEVFLDDPFAAEEIPFAEESLLEEVVPSPKVFVPPAPVAPVATPSPLPIVSVSPSVVAPSLMVETAATVGTVSDAQLELIVERVAEVVISRLAGTLLEKIAWEVVPDLAETMIKEELRKIRESVSTD